MHPTGTNLYNRSYETKGDPKGNAVPLISAPGTLSLPTSHPYEDGGGKENKTQ